MIVIIEINGYWTDKNNNKWDCEKYTKKSAKEASESLVDCYNCNNCHHCYYCYNCSNCINCRNCRSCFNCDNSQSCVRCRECNRCDYCQNCDSCIDCFNCRNCTNCQGCFYCDSCHDYKSNPQRYTTDEINGIDDQVTFYYGRTIDNEKKVQISCIVFTGDNLKEFEKAVLKRHEDSAFRRGWYLKEIEKVKVLFELEVE